MLALPNIALSADIMTATSFFLTGVISAIAFTKRFREEARKSRVLTLEEKSLDYLFLMRSTLRETINRVEDIPDVTDDASAQELYSRLRPIRRTLRELEQDYFLLGDDENSSKFAAKLSDAEIHYAAFLDGFHQRQIDYQLINRFKQVVYDLLEDVELKILSIYEENGASRAMAIVHTKNRYQRIRQAIQELNR